MKDIFSQTVNLIWKEFSQQIKDCTDNTFELVEMSPCICSKMIIILLFWYPLETWNTSKKRISKLFPFCDIIETLIEMICSLFAFEQHKGTTNW
jgi:hypothetical protein